jgi:hypothetical protein
MVQVDFWSGNSLGSYSGGVLFESRSWNRYSDRCDSGFFSGTLGKCWDINLDQNTADSFLILTNPTFILHFYVIQKEDIYVTGREVPLGCETSRLPHYLYNPLRDGVDVSLTRRPPLTLQEDS